MTHLHGDDALTEREQAVISLLRLIEDHLQVLVRITQSYGDAELVPFRPGEPRDPTDVMLSLGRMNRRRWRVGDVEDALYNLAACRAPFGSDYDPGIAYARAVYHEYVCRLPEYDRASREWNANKGVRWMARWLDGPVVACQEMLPVVRHEDTDQRNERIRELKAAGHSHHEIAKLVGCSKSTVTALFAGKRVRRGRTISATGVDK